MLAGEALGEAAEDLREDDARVAAGAHEGAEADRGGDAVRLLPADALTLLEGGADGGEHVRAGVAVRDGVDVERVELVDVRLDRRDRGAERAQEALAVAGAARHPAASASATGRSSLVSGAPSSVASWTASRGPASARGVGAAGAGVGATERP